MSQVEIDLKEYLKKDIMCSMYYASNIIEKPHIVKKLSMLLCQIDYLGFWDVAEELSLVNYSMFAS